MSQQSPFGGRAAQMFPTLPKGEVLGTFESYPEAQRVVAQLAAADFPVSRVAIVGNDLKTVERVTGKMTYGRAAIAGAVTGLWLGLFFGIVMSLFSSSGSGVWFAAALIGAAFGMLYGVVSFSVTKRQRDFTSVHQVLASNYQIVVDPQLVGQAKQILGRTGLGQSGQSFPQPQAPQQYGQRLQQPVPPQYGGQPQGGQYGGQPQGGQYGGQQQGGQYGGQPGGTQPYGAQAGAPQTGGPQAPRYGERAPQEPPRYGERVPQAQPPVAQQAPAPQNTAQQPTSQYPTSQPSSGHVGGSPYGSAWDGHRTPPADASHAADDPVAPAADRAATSEHADTADADKRAE